MNLSLVRKRNDESGIYSELVNGAGDLIAYTIEHAYSDSGIWAPKVPVGSYICNRGKHLLDNGKPAFETFETFEIMGVPGHTGILFHKGNTEDNSHGCVLLGSVLNGNTLLNSAKAFELFMVLMDGINSFALKVS